MSWRKRPSTIKTEKESTRAVFHLGILDYEAWEQMQRAAFPKGVDRPTKILTGDLSYT